MFALVDGVVRFERKGRDKKQVSIYPVAENKFWLESSDGMISLQMAKVQTFFRSRLFMKPFIVMKKFIYDERRDKMFADRAKILSVPERRRRSCKLPQRTVCT